MFTNKKAAELAVNTVVMMIIGLVIFGLGMGLFAKISGSADDELNSLNDKVKNDIASLECQGDDWICVPSNTIKNGGQETFEMFVSNHGDDKDEFNILLNLEDVDSGKYGIKNDCGAVIITYPSTISLNIKSGYSGSLPFIVKATRVSKTPCSFITSANLTKVGVATSVFEEKASVIIKVK